MKLRLQLFLYCFFVYGALLFTTTGYSQISYSQDFETNESGWTINDGFYYEEYAACSGASLMGGVYNFPGDGFYPITSVSGSIGISNGNQAVLTYSYKMLGTGVNALTNSPDWGDFVIEYATSTAGPWTVIQKVAPENHTESADCTAKTVNFIPEESNAIFLRIVCSPNVNEDLLYSVYFDDIVVTQSVVEVCSGAPAPMVTVTDKAIVCNEQNVSLSLNPSPVSVGLIYQWQSSLDGTTYTDIADGTNVVLTATQASSTWYRANVSCGVTGTVVTSTPVQVITLMAPEAISIQSFCGSATVADLQTTGETEVKWYQDETGGTPLNEDFVLINNGVYYVSQTIECESSRAMVTVTINTIEAPSGDDTISDSTGTLTLSQIELEATGTITWYANTEDVASGENVLPEDTLIPAGSTTYYATQTIGDCESASFAVTVDVVLGTENFDSAAFKYYPNPVNNVLNVSYSNTITAVTVFNLLGQQIVAKNTNQDAVQVDLSQLTAGTYMVKIQFEDAFKVIKIVKK